MPLPLRARLGFRLLAGAALALLAPPLVAQRPASPATAAAASPGAPSVPQACQAAPSSGSLGTSLPTPVLDYLETRTASPFVQGFLIGYVADNGAADHWLAKCARAFTEATLTDPGALRLFPLAPASLLHELRYAEEARQRETAIRRFTADTLRRLIAELGTTGGAPHIEVFLPALDSARARFCRSAQAAPCPELAAVIAKLQAAQEAINSAGQSAAQAEALAAGRITAEAVALAAARRAAQSTALARSAARSAALGSAVADSVARRADSVAAFTADSIAAFRADSTAADSAAVVQADAASKAVTGARTAAATATTAALNAVASFASRSPAFFVNSVAKLAPFVVKPAPSLLASSAPPASTQQRVQVVQSSGIVAALTDYVIDQAKQELIYFTLTRFYGEMARDTLLKQTFPESFSLMRGLARGAAPERVRGSAFSVVPLNVWRSTLTSDYQALPVRLFSTGDGLFCRTAACREHLSQIRPLATTASLLLRGEGPLAALEEASIAIAGAQLPDYQRRIGQGISVLAAIASAYQEQGGAISADVLHQPYVISANNLLDAPRQQRAAFLRVLVMRATAKSSDRLAAMDTAAFFRAVRSATEAVELILTQARTGEVTPAQASTNFARSLAAFSRAAEVAASLDPALQPLVDSTRKRWAQFGGVLDPLVARNYGLALTRVTILYRDVSDSLLPPGLLRLAALGASLADAQDADQVKQAFAAVRPATFGYEAKRYREDSRFTLTGFVGIAAGSEHLLDGSAATSVWPAIPVGLEIPLSPKYAGAVGKDAPCAAWIICSAGVLATVLDLGAPLSWRQGHDPAVVSSPNPSWEQVFAPGAYLDLGIRHTPLSFIMGGQYIPNLRRPTAAGGEITGSVVRLGAGVAADVTLFKF